MSHSQATPSFTVMEHTLTTAMSADSTDAESTKERRPRIRNRRPTKYTLKEILRRMGWKYVDPISSPYWDNALHQRLMAEKHVNNVIQEGGNIYERELHSDIELSISGFYQFLWFEDSAIDYKAISILLFEIERNRAYDIHKAKIVTRIHSYTSPAFLDVAFDFFESQELSSEKLEWSVRYRLTTKPRYEFRLPQVPRGKSRAGWKIMVRAADVKGEIKKGFRINKQDLKQIRKALFGKKASSNTVRQKFTRIKTCELMLVSVGIAIDTSADVGNWDFQDGDHRFKLSDLHWLGDCIRKLGGMRVCVPDSDEESDEGNVDGIPPGLDVDSHLDGAVPRGAEEEFGGRLDREDSEESIFYRGPGLELEVNWDSDSTVHSSSDDESESLFRIPSLRRRILGH